MIISWFFLFVCLNNIKECHRYCWYEFSQGSEVSPLRCIYFCYYFAVQLFFCCFFNFIIFFCFFNFIIICSPSPYFARWRLVTTTAAVLNEPIKVLVALLRLSHCGESFSCSSWAFISFAFNVLNFSNWAGSFAISSTFSSSITQIWWCDETKLIFF